MRSTGELAGLLMVAVGGLALFVFEILQFADWWGFWGVLVAVVFPPLALAFPFVFWIKEEFSLLYMGLLVLMFAGVAVLAYVDSREAQRRTPV